MAVKEAQAVKVTVTADMAGQTAFILTEPEKTQVCEFGEFIPVTFHPQITGRSREQLNLYWACCGLVADNLADNANFNTKAKVDRQCKFACRFFDEDMHIRLKLKDGGEQIYFELGSISFSALDRASANGYFAEAFAQLAEFIGVTEEELVREAKNKMQSVKICKLCGHRATDKHHLFSNTKLNRQKYGKLIDNDANIMYLCNDCHLNKPIPKMTEKEFCKAVKIKIDEEAI